MGDYPGSPNEPWDDGRCYHCGASLVDKEPPGEVEAALWDKGFCSASCEVSDGE